MVFLSEGLSPLPRYHHLQKGLEDYLRHRRLLRIGRCFPSPSGHLLQGVLCFISHSKAPGRLVFCNFAVFAASSVSRSGMRP
ncbi:hypothetical protein F2Q70_00024826 [Brassica cretica]|uniref:Uncharacterized protein n=1 Tax=Brassica cretica TaxID=69181 RepID=A0A8S9IIJ1_BRACR|nr:hypothetical protein F2Q68_00024177 [Brassica cretica]KAF2604934.1 hypothetical protein F2Q70_00024826 [Brassica cretica]